jgi:uncharacterized protein
MRLLLEAHHPAHIHFFKHAIKDWRDRGYDVLMLGRDRDVMRQLLEAYDWIPSKLVSEIGGDNSFPLREMLQRQAAVLRQLVAFRPNLVLSLMGSYTQSSKLLGVRNVVFTDSEFQHFNHRIAHPFADRIYTPNCFWKDLGPKQRRYPGYHELAFLHPTRFTPRREVLQRMGGVEAGDYLIVRVSAWDTLHDVGESGFGNAFDEFMEEATRRYRVFVVPERGMLAERWQQYRLRIPPDYFHDALAFARFTVTEGASTAAESACLGVPSLYLNTTSRGYLDDISARYGLVSSHANARSALREVRKWLTTPPDLERAKEAQTRLIADHVDVTAYVVDEISQLLDNHSS